MLCELNQSKLVAGLGEDPAEKQKSEDAEAQQRGRVCGPPLFYLFLHADDFVGEHFKPPQHRMQERALSFEDLRHERAQRLGTNEDQPQKDRDLQNSNTCHNSPSELLRTEKRVNQVRKQPQRRDTRNDVIHNLVLLLAANRELTYPRILRAVLKLIAGLREDPAHQHKCTTDSYVE